MKKPVAPKKPAKPYCPTEPYKTYKVPANEILGDLPRDEPLTLNKLIKLCTPKGEQVDLDREFFIDAEIHDDSYDAYLTAYILKFRDAPNKAYAAQLRTFKVAKEKYEKSVQQYELAFAKYEEELAKYEEEMLKYAEEQRHRTIVQLEKQLLKLKNEI